MATFSVSQLAAASRPAPHRCAKKARACPATPKPKPKAPPKKGAAPVQPPSVVGATVSGAQVTITYDKTVTSAPVSSFTATVDGTTTGLASSAANGKAVSLTLASPVSADDLVALSTGSASVAVTNLTPSTVPFSPQLAKPGWADDPSSTPVPEYGEWPVDHERFVSSQHTRVLMLFVDFPDAAGTLTPQSVRDAYVTPALKWLAAASYGRADVHVDVAPRWYRMPQPSTAYQLAQRREDVSFMKSVAATAVSLADPDVDFSKYDAVWIWSSSNGTFSVTQLRTWPGNGVAADGKEIDHFEFEDASIPSGTFDDLGHPMDATASANLLFTHELLHHMGTPDSSYKPDAATPYDFSFVGGWDMQDSPAGISHHADYLVWNKWRLGWLDPSQLRGLDTPGTLTTSIEPDETVGGIKAVVVPIDASDAYVVEVRRKLGNDVGMSCDEGVLVYTVDSSKRNGLAPVHVLPSQASTDATRIATCGLKYAAPFHEGQTYEDDRVKVEVLATNGAAYRVRVTRK